MLNHAMTKREGRTPTIREVAKLARVGLMTVSRVINNSPSVRPSTRKKVQAAIAQLGYRQNEAARLLKGQRAMMIGLIVPDLADAFFASCAHTVQHIARAHGYMTLVVASERDADLEVQQAELMASRKVSGLLIVTSTTRGEERLQELQNTGLSIVAFDRPLEGIHTDCVLTENRAGAEAAVQHLIDHGHRRIACVGYDEQVYTIHERTQGYANRMLAAGLSPEIASRLASIDDVRAWARKALKGEKRPMAIFTLNNRTSTFVLQALKEMEIKIPDQVALAGFDDFELASMISPAFTAVAQSPVEMATRSMALLMERIQGLRTGKAFTPAKILLPVELRVRSSCGSHSKPATPQIRQKPRS